MPPLPARIPAEPRRLSPDCFTIKKIKAMKSPIIQQLENVWACRIHGVKPMACVTILRFEYFEGGVMVQAEITELNGVQRKVPFLFAKLGKIYSPQDWEDWMPDNTKQLGLIDWCEGYLGYPAAVYDGHVYDL